MKTKTTRTNGLFRMPWSQTDNAFSWLEPTRKCNLACEYCYQRNDPDSHKSLQQVEMELNALNRLRKCDTMIIAGGEPLVHPQIVSIVRMVKASGVKPVILTNGELLTAELLHDLKTAGAFGIIFHVDSHQNRPGWKNKNEKELNALRQKFADMVFEEGGLVCGYNTTILPETLSEVPEIVKWTLANIHKVASNVLIPVRSAHADDPYDYYAGIKKIEVSKTPYASDWKYENLTAADIVGEIRKVLPDYAFHSYLGGTVVADAPKWLFGTHIGTRKKIIGNIGPKAGEWLQLIHRLFRGRYLSLPGVFLNGNGWLAFFFAAFDSLIFKALRGRLSGIIRNPVAIFKRLWVQNFIIMQPHDMLQNGEQDECDGCPNKTYWNGRLVSECRKEDYLLYGRPVMALPKAFSEDRKKYSPICRIISFAAAAKSFERR